MQLISSVPTVKFTIAQPKAMDALAMATVKLVGLARMLPVLNITGVAGNFGFQLHAYFFEIRFRFTIAVLAHPI